MKVSRVYRLLKLITLLQTGKSYMANDLASELEVSRRTLFRDLNLIRLAGVPLHYDSAAQRYAIAKSFFLPPINFTLSETLGLMIILKKYASRAHSPNAEAFSAAIMKIESTLPRDVQEYCGTALDSIECWHAPATAGLPIPETFEILLKAAQTHRIVQMHYESYYEGHDIITRLHAYRLMFISRAWYVIGHSEMHDMTRTFKLDRIFSLEPTSESFAPVDFDIRSYFGNAWSMIRGDKRYHVRIRFSPKVAGNVEEVLWHPTQEMHLLEDGSMHYEVDVDGVDEIAWWVLGYGKEAVVEEPPELQRIIRAHVVAMSAAYADS